MASGHVALHSEAQWMIGVTLFPTQTETDALLLIVLASTGITYTNQVGGTGCDLVRAEGFLVPVGHPRNLKAVRTWFRKRFGESCWCDGRLAATPALTEELSRVVAQIPCWSARQPAPLALDHQRLSSGCEAWVPVLSAFGPGWLTWTNSD
jgi:hypothetical protein